MKLFSGAAELLQLLMTDRRFASVKVAVASTTTEPRWANCCLDVLRFDPERGETMADIVKYRQVSQPPGRPRPSAVAHTTPCPMRRSTRAPRGANTSPGFRAKAVSASIRCVSGTTARMATTVAMWP